MYKTLWSWQKKKTPNNKSHWGDEFCYISRWDAEWVFSMEWELASNVTIGLLYCFAINGFIVKARHGGGGDTYWNTQGFSVQDNLLLSQSKESTQIISCQKHSSNQV